MSAFPTMQPPPLKLNVTADPSTPKSAGRLGVWLDVADDVAFSCVPRADLGRGKVALSVGDGGADAEPLTVVLGGAALCDLYLELRRFLGELGGHGPTPPDAQHAIARLYAPLAEPVADVA